MNYCVYDGGTWIASFASLEVAVDFIESWRSYSNVEIDLVDANTAEVIDTWIYGAWENGDY